MSWLWKREATACRPVLPFDGLDVSVRNVSVTSRLATDRPKHQAYVRPTLTRSSETVIVLISGVFVHAASLALKNQEAKLLFNPFRQKYNIFCEYIKNLLVHGNSAGLARQRRLACIRVQ